MISDQLTRLRYKYVPDHVVGELLVKKWMDNAIPFATLFIVFAIFRYLEPRQFSFDMLGGLGQQYAELSMLVLGMTIVMLSGGIDLSVGSIYALSVLTSVIGMNALSWGFWPTSAAVLAVGLLCGALNGVLIGYLRLRAFLTTLVTLITFRSIYELVYPGFSTAIASNLPNSAIWDQLGFGTLYGVPWSFILAAVIVIVWHLALSRMRPGWRLLAVGNSRRSALNAGINVRCTVFLAYLWSGILCSLAGLLNAARLSTAGSDVGVGLELSVLTAAIIGGVSLGGGRGSVPKAVIGTIIVLILINGLMGLSISGPINSLVLGILLITAVFVDVRWVKNRHKLINTVYVSPTYFAFGETAHTETGSDSPFAQNDRLRDVGVIGLGILEGPEDMVLDRDDRLYCGTRHGDIIRFFPPDYKEYEIFAHVGGHPLGLAVDADNNINVCIGGMGLYKVTQDRQIIRLSDETNRTRFSVIDDSRLKLADDLDIAPDGSIYFSEATIRYEMHDWPVDALECRGNGRIVRYDPKTGKSRTVLPRLIFPNGICMCHDGESFLFAETWACRVSRYFFAGSKRGQVELVMENMPGYPDNINRASDGNFWLAFAGVRAPALDLACSMPAFRKRMARRCSPDNWLYPNLNTGLVIKFTESGEVLGSLWDKKGENHPMITSIREHKGVLYLGGIHNNRIGTYPIPGADSEWTGYEDYWGGGGKCLT